VRETDKTLVLEVAFDSIHESKRHKSGLAMRFPRISRIRNDKPAHEADTIETLRKLAT
jgi:DNA ligase-1